MDSLDRQIDRYIEMVKQGDRNIDRQIGYKVRYNRTALIDIQIDKYSSSEWSNMGIETQIDRKVNRYIWTAQIDRYTEMVAPNGQTWGQKHRQIGR